MDLPEKGRRAEEEREPGSGPLAKRTPSSPSAPSENFTSHLCGRDPGTSATTVPCRHRWAGPGLPGDVDGPAPPSSKSVAQDTRRPTTVAGVRLAIADAARRSSCEGGKKGQRERAVRRSCGLRVKVLQCSLCCLRVNKSKHACTTASANSAFFAWSSQ